MILIGSSVSTTFLHCSVSGLEDTVLFQGLIIMIVRLVLMELWLDLRPTQD